MSSERFSFAYLKQKISITTVLADKGILPQLIRRGDRLYGPCPIHRGDNPQAFVVSLKKNLWHCFTGCQSGGDLIELVLKLDNKSYFEVAQYLFTLPKTSSLSFISGPASAKPFPPFTRKLPLDPTTPFLGKKGITPMTAHRFEVGAYHLKGFLAGCVGVRLHDVQGRPLGYAGRRLDTLQAKKYGKWLFPPRFPKKNILYNFHRVNSNLQNGLIVVECPWGVMRLTQLNLPAVALLGTNLSTVQCHLLSKAPKIILMLDGDQAGRKATSQIRNALLSHTRIYCINLPTGQDPDDLSDRALLAFSRYFLL